MVPKFKKGDVVEIDGLEYVVRMVVETEHVITIRFERKFTAGITLRYRKDI